jgi:ElaB/YqjD/DUF883 family membrane-anchored ribosome-binding protein
MDQSKAQGSSKTGGFPDSSRDSEAVSSTASNAIDAGVDLKALQSDLSELKEKLAKLVSRTSDQAAESARDIAGQVSTAASDLAEKGANAASVATGQAKTLVTELENIARRNPLGALAGAVIVGVLIGMMGRRN